MADSVELQRELFISNSGVLPRIDGKPRSLLSDHCIYAFKIMAHIQGFLTGLWKHKPKLSQLDAKNI